MEYLISIIDELLIQNHSVKNDHQVEFTSIVSEKLNFIYCTIDLQKKEISMYFRGKKKKSTLLTEELVEYIKLKIF